MSKSFKKYPGGYNWPKTSVRIKKHSNRLFRRKNKHYLKHTVDQDNATFIIKNELENWWRYLDNGKIKYFPIQRCINVNWWIFDFMGK